MGISGADKSLPFWDSCDSAVDENLVTYVCHKCCKQIENLPGLLEKAYSERGNILKMICLHLHVHGGTKMITVKLILRSAWH